jgi:hypothetical protein
MRFLPTKKEGPHPLPVAFLRVSVVRFDAHKMAFIPKADSSSLSAFTTIITIRSEHGSLRE